jgi:hypothetical protein
MPRKITIPPYESYKYLELWKITAWKDESIWSARPFGNIKAEHEPLLDKQEFTTSSLSTSITFTDQDIQLEVWTEEELKEWQKDQNEKT